MCHQQCLVVVNTFGCRWRGWLAGSHREPSKGFPAVGREASNKSHFIEVGADAGND